MNLISVDCPNLQKALRFIHFPWSCPLQICVSLYFLYDILKGAMIPGKKCDIFSTVQNTNISISSFDEKVTLVFILFWLFYYCCCKLTSKGDTYVVFSFLRSQRYTFIHERTSTIILLTRGKSLRYS